MTFLIDENVSTAVLKSLKGRGFESARSADLCSEGASDDDVYATAKKEGHILITRDYHFTNPLRFPTNETKGIIFIRHGTITSNEEASLVVRVINNLSPEEIENHLIIVSRDAITVR